MNDDKLKQLLKDESYKPGKNEWFTPRLLNRLPARQHSTSWLTVLTLLIAVVACGAAWLWMLGSISYTAITVRDIIYFTSLLAVSGIVTWQVLKALVLADE